MASPDAIRKALMAILRKADEAVPDIDPTAQAIARGQRNPTIGLTPLTKEVPTTSDVIPTTPAPGKPIPGRGETGPGPDTLAESLGTKFDIEEEGVRPKQFLDALEDEMDKLSTQVPLDELEATATKNVEAAFEAISPKKKFKSVQERKRVEGGRKAAIARGEQKYMPRGNVKYTSRYDKPPAAFGETSEFAPGEASLGVPREVKDLMDEASGPVSKLRQQKRIRPGKESMDVAESAEQLDNLSGEFEKGQIGKIQDELDTDIFLQTLSPELQKSAARDILIPKSVRLKEIDEAALDLFGGPNKAGLIPETQGALSGKDISRKQDFTIKTTPPKRGEGELAQVGQSSAQLHKFRTLASQVTDAAREANKIKPNMDKVHRIISKMPEEVKTKLRPAFENETLDEALADLMQQLVRRMTR